MHDKGKKKKKNKLKIKAQNNELIQGGTSFFS
jgi:hypothetical protein